MSSRSEVNGSLLVTNIEADKKAFDVFIGSTADFLISPELLESHLYIGVMPLDEIANSNPPSGPASHIIGGIAVPTLKEDPRLEIQVLEVVLVPALNIEPLPLGLFAIFRRPRG